MKSPWLGGFYEHLIQVLKRVLHKLLRNARLNHEELLIILTDSEFTINSRPFTVKTVHACPDFEVSCPTFECLMRRFGNRLQRFAPNAPTFRQNVRANLSNFIQDLFWCVRYSNEHFKMVEREVFKRRFQDGRRRPC